jgi:hypothetical protein
LHKGQYLLVAALAATGWGGPARAQARAAAAPPEEDELEVGSAPAAPPPAAAPAAPPPAAAPAPPPAPVAVAPPPPAPPPAAPPPPAGPDQALHRWQADTSAQLQSLQARVEASLAAAAAAAPPPAVPPPPVDTLSETAPSGDGEGQPTVPAAPGLTLSGYTQAQYLASQASQDQLQQGGAYLNQDQFTVRRARLRADRRWAYAALTLEVDGNTVGGMNFGVRRAEASLVWDRGSPGQPLAMLTAGLFYTPFGNELPAAARSRLFMERSTASSALFPGQADLGVRLSGAWRFFRYAVAVVDGEPISETASRPFRGDPNAAKDVVARAGADVTVALPVRVAGGVSFLNGRGFHPGTDATKATTVWRDINQNGQIDAGEVSAVPGASATPSANFRRWAVGADLRVTVRTRLGLSQLFGEAVLASNLDRGLFPADPVVTGLDVRELGFAAGFTQELGTRGLIGFRADVYNPNADVLDSRAGHILPASQTITTLSPLVGVRVGNRTRVSLQYDRIIDNLARDERGVPTDLRNDQLTARLQVDL